MLVRKQKVKTKSRKLPLSFKRRQLARKIVKNRALYTRLLFLRVRRIATEVSLKSSKKLLSRYADYRRARRTVIERKVWLQTQRVADQKALQNTRVASTNSRTRRLYTGRARVMRTACRRLHLRVQQYRRHNARLARARLRQYRRVLRRYRNLRRQQLSAACYRLGSLQTIRAVFPFLRASLYPVARRRAKKFYRRAARRSIRRRNLCVSLVSIHRRMLARRPKYKQKSVRRGGRRKGSLVFRKRPSFRKRASSLRVGLRLRSLFKLVSGRPSRRKSMSRYYLRDFKRRSRVKRGRSLRRVKHRRKLKRGFFLKRARRLKKLKL